MNVIGYIMSIIKTVNSAVLACLTKFRKIMKVFKILIIASLGVFTAFSSMADGTENTSQAKPEIQKAIDLSYTHFQKTGNIMLSIVPHNMDTYTLEVKNQAGEVVYTKECETNFIQNVDLSHLLTKGLYTVVLSQNNIELRTSKVIL